MDRNSRTGAIPRRSRPLGPDPRPRTGALLRALLAAGVLSLSAGAARASVLVSIDKSTQQMSVSVDGVPRYHWAVSTGRAGYGTPSGTYRPQRMERTWFSKNSAKNLHQFNSLTHKSSSRPVKLAIHIK